MHAFFNLIVVVSAAPKEDLLVKLHTEKLSKNKKKKLKKRAKRRAEMLQKTLTHMEEECKYI